MTGAGEIVNIKSLSFRIVESLEPVGQVGCHCVAHHGACMQQGLDDCSQAHSVICVRAQVPTGCPSTGRFPASQRLPPPTNPFSSLLTFSSQLAFQGSPPCQPVTHILYHTKLPLTCLEPSFFHHVLGRAVCIHSLLLPTTASL